MTGEVFVDPRVLGLKLGIVFATGMQLAPSSAEQLQQQAAAVKTLLETGVAGGDARREAVRRLLRAGGFKPAGRNKPAQEYLLRTATESGSLPAILNAVDALNQVSLCSGLPISLLSAAQVGTRARVRYGVAGERFVFNRSGQELELEGLICVCSSDHADQPLGTPIKDSMAGKVTEADHDVMAILYAPESISAAELADWTRQLADLFQQWCSAECQLAFRDSGTADASIGP